MATSATILSDLSGSYVSGVSRPFGWRRKQLQGIHDLVRDNTDALVEAALTDKRLVRADVLLELASLLHLVGKQLDDVIRASCESAKPQFIETSVLTTFGQRRRAAEGKTPVGIVLVNPHWAFPYSSSLGVMALAYASGNVVALVPPAQPRIASILTTKLRKAVDQLGYATLDFPDSVKPSEQANNIAYPSITALDVKGGGLIEPLLTITPSRNPSAVYINYTALGSRSEVKFTPRRSKVAKDIARRIVQSKIAFNGQAFQAPSVAFLDSEVYDEVVAQIVATAKDVRGSTTPPSKFGDQIGLKALVQGPLCILEIDAKAASDVKLAPTDAPLLLLSKVNSPDTAVDRLQYLPRLPAFYLFSQEPFTSYVVKNIDSDLTVVNDIPIDVLANPFSAMGATLASAISSPQAIITHSGVASSSTPATPDLERKLLHAISTAQITRLDEGPGTRWDFFDQVKLAFTVVKYLSYTGLVTGGYLAYRRLTK